MHQVDLSRATLPGACCASYVIIAIDAHASFTELYARIKQVIKKKSVKKTPWGMRLGPPTSESSLVAEDWQQPKLSGTDAKWEA